MAFRDVIDFYEESDRNRADVLNEPLEYLLQNDNYLKELAERIQADLDTVSNSLGTEYTKTEDLNDLLANGVKGDKGDAGVGLEYNWDGTSLGVKREDETDYSYVDLQGPAGNAGLEEAEIQTMINQAVDSIVVPTKTSELVNDSNFITEDDIPDPVDVSQKADFVSTYYKVADSTIIDNMLDSFALVAINSTSHSTLHSILNSNFAYIHTYFYNKKNTTVNRYQIARAYTGSALATRQYVNGIWSEWARIPIGIINNLTSTSTTTPVSAYQAKILNDKIESANTEIEDLKTISVNWKNKLTSAINGVLGTSYTSSTSYSELVSAINKMPTPQSYLNCIRYGVIESNTSSSSSDAYSVTNLRMIIVSARYTIRFRLSKTATIVSVNSSAIDTYTITGSNSMIVKATDAEAILFTVPFTGEIYVIECDNNKNNNVAFIADAVEKTN